MGLLSKGSSEMRADGLGVAEETARFEQLLLPTSKACNETLTKSKYSSTIRLALRTCRPHPEEGRCSPA
jgi:hypothetical protein